MKRKAIIPLILGLGIGFATVKLVVDTIRKARAAGETTRTVKVVRAKHDIRAHEAVTREMVELVETVESLFVPADDRFESLDKAEDGGVIGRVAKKAIPGRTPVLRSMLAPEGTPAGMVGRIPSGFRAVSVKIDEVTGVAFQLKPGDWVDVIVVMDIDTHAGRGKETIAEVILQHVQVAAIGHTTDVDATQQGTRVKPAKSATLFVREEHVPKLHLAATRGKITLAMRGDDKETTHAGAFATLGDVVTDLRSPGDVAEPATTPPVPKFQLRAQPEPEPPHTVLVFHGSPTKGAGKGADIERITFENPRSSRIIGVSMGAPTRGDIGRRDTD